MMTNLGVDKLDGYAHAFVGPLHAPFEHVANVELAADCPRVDQLPLVGEGSVARDYEGAPDARQISRQAFCDAVNEVSLFGVIAQIGEWQNDDRETRRFPRDTDARGRH